MTKTSSSSSFRVGDAVLYTNAAGVSIIARVTHVCASCIYVEFHKSGTYMQPCSDMVLAADFGTMLKPHVAPCTLDLRDPAIMAKFCNRHA